MIRDPEVQLLAALAEGLKRDGSASPSAISSRSSFGPVAWRNPVLHLLDLEQALQVGRHVRVGVDRTGEGVVDPGQQGCLPHQNSVLTGELP